MRLKYDLDVGALYIRLTDAGVARTREVDDNTVVDLDASGGVVGIRSSQSLIPGPSKMSSVTFPSGRRGGTDPRALPDS